MSATRTQIYLTALQRERIDQVATAEGVTLAEVVRRALDDYFEHHAQPAGHALDATFGADPDVTAPSRDEWTRG